MRACLVAILLASCGPSASTTGTTEPTAQPAADPAQLVDALLGDQPTAAWSATENHAIFTTSYQEEGTGAGLSVIIVGTEGAGEDIEVYTPGQDVAEATAQARSKLLARVTGKGFATMTYTAWPDGAASVKLPTGTELTWTNNALSSAGRELTTIAPEEPHTPAPSGVFSLAGANVIVFVYAMDPGEAYAEGFNAFTGSKVLSI